MDIKTASSAHILYEERQSLRGTIIEMQSIMKAFPSGIGTATITVRASWLPEIIAIAEREYAMINEEIDRL